MSMIVCFHPTPIIFLFLLLLVSDIITQAFSQPPYEQNSQTFYPFLYPPPPPTPTPTVGANMPRGLSTRAAVGMAIAVTLGATLALSGVLFFMLLLCWRRKLNKVVGVTSDEEMNKVLPLNDLLLHGMKWNLKGVIVDEHGVDVLYFRDLEVCGNGLRFKKQIYRSLEEEDKSSPPVQELPFLRSKLSTSESDRKIEEKRNSSLQFGNRVGAPPPPPLKQSIPAYVESVPQPAQSSPADFKTVPIEKTASVPPPPPPPMKGPAPPPTQFSTANFRPVPKREPPATTPPPPPLPIKRPAPRPTQSTPRPPAWTSANTFASPSLSSTKNTNEEIKLKPLHWEKVNPNSDHSMVWDNIVKGSFRFDDELMQSLFGFVSTETKSPRSKDRYLILQEGKKASSSQIFILDPRKSQNTAIVLKSLGVARQEVIDSLIEGQGLNGDTIEKLTKIAPTQEETSQLLAFVGDPTKLADAESFLYHLLKAVPSAFIRFKAMLFKTSYDSEVSHIRESLQCLESACKELRTRGLFLKLLEAVLKTGNRLNAGTSRGNAQAFNLTALKKLSDVKASDGKTTLLQFVVQEVVRAEGKRCVLNKNRSMHQTQNDDTEREYMIHGLPIVGGLSSEFSSVKKAATLDNDALIKMISTLETQMSEVQKTVEKCGCEGEFVKRMKGFLESAEVEMQRVKEEQTRVMEFVKRTTHYYHAGSSKDYETNPIQLFVIIKDFLFNVDHVCVEITRNVQKRKMISSLASSSSPVSVRVHRFPKLPIELMYKKFESSSSSSSSSIHSDSEND